ncbi:hemopexin repeat-containing protein [Plantactinospora sp. BC1]|uniref:hemopexin repeat-containing protein n=1 Tax=Plantactinospora sp. BC1 TaxID=2108470 RepID=UPI00131F1A5E|nr:hemopexin repeat-containing protein [Plantactinospora sp. BC1]
MHQDDLLPSYDELFGDLPYRPGDEARTVHSPAAYLADLLQLLGDGEGGAPAELVVRRPDLRSVPLDAEHTQRELPYLDIVNEVLERAVRKGQLSGENESDGESDGVDAYTLLAGLRYPFTMPFSLPHERVRRHLEHLGVDPAELYRRFATHVDPDTVAREYLGLTPADVALLTSALPDGPALRECWHLGAEEPFDALEPVERFRRAAALTEAEVLELLFQNLSATPTGDGPAERAASSAFFVHQGGAVVTLDEETQRLRPVAGPAVPVEWFDRVNRFVRLARRTGLTLSELDLVLRTCCGNRIDLAALRTIAVLLHLRRGFDLPVDVLVSLVAPIDTLGFGDGPAPQDLFNRIFNVPFVGAERSVLRGSAYLPARYADLAELTCQGDILAARNADYRRRIGAALSMSDGDLTAVVNWFRRTDARGPFDGETGLPALSLLHRVSRLATALGVPVGELLDVLDALDADPSLHRYPVFSLLVEADAPTPRVAAVLAGGDVPAGLWLVQTLRGTVEWLRASGLTGRELIGVLGGDAAAGPTGVPDGLPGLLDRLRQEFETVAFGPDLLRQEFETVAFGPDLLRSDRFGERGAQVLHGVLAGEIDAVVSARDDRLLRVEPDTVASAAYRAVTALPVVVDADFVGLGIGERGAAKIFANLLAAGYLEPGGELVPDRIPATPDELALSADFSEYREQVFALVAEVNAGAGTGGADGELPAVPAAFFPSDLVTLAELSVGERAELYDNLIFNGYLDPDGNVTRPDFFAEPANVETFAVNAHLGGVTDDLLALLRDRADRFGRERLPLDPTIFAGLRLTGPRLGELLHSLRFNGYLDAGDGYLDPVALLDLPITDFQLALEFHPHRRRVLAAMQEQVRQARAQTYRMTEEDFRDVADAGAARRVMAELAGTYLLDGRVPVDRLAEFADPGNILDLPGFTESENATVFDRIAEIVAEQQPYHLDPAALADLGFDPGQQNQLVAHLAGAGHLTESLTVPEDRLDYFGTVQHALDFVIPGLEDFSRDIFFLLYAIATELTDAIAEITDALTAGETAQRGVLGTVGQDVLGMPASTVEAICVAVTGSTADALDLLVVPALAGADPATPDAGLHRAYRRIVGFARLAGKLGLAADEVTCAFRDQNLVEKFPEPLALPAEVDRIDALLESADGRIYLFRNQSYWTYSADTYALLEPGPKPLAALWPRFAELSRVDAAFVDGTGTEWIVGRNDGGSALAFVRERGGTRWAPRTQSWGTVLNNFTDPARIDAAYVDDEGRIYLFCGDQYVRYSGSEHSHADQGYPRRIGEWWESEQHRVGLPASFRRSLDAAFRGRDGRTYLFADDRFVAVGPGGASDAAQPIAESWGRVRNNLAATGRVDAGYVAGPAQYLVAGNQVVRYTDSLENDGVRVDSGCPLRIGAQLPGVPAEFEGGLEAAFVDPTGALHLFRDGRTVTIRDGSAGEVVPTARRWGVLGPVLPSGTVDAAMVGLDGRTYLFSGDQYLRYSGADYSAVDLGYPRGTAGDWAGLRTVGAAFVLDGATHLFGSAGLLFEIGLAHATELDAGRLPRSVRQRLAEHGVPVADDAAVSGAAPQWQLAAGHRIELTLRRTENAIGVHCEPATETAFHVRYSTRDYTTPDAGYPRPLADNFWNLPEELVGEEAAFARIDAVLTARDNRSYLFSGDRYVVFDNKRRWWSAPKSLRTEWDSLPFDRVDAAFVGADGHTYVFAGDRYVRYSDGNLNRVDDRYPARITPYWGNVVNSIARTGRVDAALVVDSAALFAPGTKPVPKGVGPTYTYLFSGDQFVRYTGTEYGTVDDGYPRSLAELSAEPVLGNLVVPPDRVDAAFADRRNVYLFSGPELAVVSATAYRRYAELPGVVPPGDERPGSEPPRVELAGVRCGYLEDGAVLVERADGWHRYGALEGTAVDTTPVRPRGLRTVPAEYRTGLDAVLSGVDGNTYLFKGTSCFNVRLGRGYPLAEEWGRPRNNIYHHNRVDAGFVGRDGRTYLFSGDQFVVYPGTAYLDAPVEAEPRPVAEHWAGLPAVALAFVHDDVTYLFAPPEQDGTVRYLAYSGETYGQPDDGYPAVLDADFWDIPEPYRPAGFLLPDAVLVEGESMLLLAGAVCLQRDGTSGTWSYPRPVERIWPGIGSVDGLTAAFTGRDGATYFFFAETFTRYHDRTFTGREAIRERWGRSKNNFLTDGGRVDAAVVVDGVSYLFSGDQYARYSGTDYRYADTGYPRPIVGNLRTEEPFGNLPAGFDDELAERALDGAGPLVDAVLANARNCYLFAGGALHVVSRKPTASYPTDRLGRVRNTVAERGRVDAALVTDSHTFVFSADQYVRYSGRDYAEVDDGYPRTIAAGLPAELGIAELPAEFTDGIDAAFRDGAGRTYLFAGRRYLRIEGTSAVAGPVAGAWGAVRSGFGAATPVEAAFVGPEGHLYVFAGNQYVRYQPGKLDAVEEGHPRPIRDNWGDLPTAFEQGVDGAFVLGGRTYLCRGEEYVRYSGDGFDAVDRTLPQPFRHRFTGSVDYRLADVRAITRFTGLARAYPGDGGLAAFLLPGPETVADPYQHLGELFGWDVEELKWCRRHSRFLTGGPVDEERFEIEFLVELADLFAFAARLGAGPSRIRAEVWARLHQDGSPAALDAAATALAGLLARRHGPAEWAALAGQIHDELNVRRRDALVPVVIAGSAGRTPEFRTPRDLYEYFLIDVEMGGRGRTSRIREAIAATQLYLHRYLLNLESGGATDVGAALTRQRLKGWWSWMRSYRVWEANRKVFLHPENYLRPELRASKTPAFRALESDLLSGEITAASVERAYKRYLDEYTEVSRLTIAGGYVYTQDRDPDGRRRLVLFGRTKTDPRRYYYRRAEFGSREKLSATWEPWQRVELQIDADQVHPVHAFGRVFVFWATTETVPANADPGSTTVVVADSGEEQRVSGQAGTQRIKIYYSFYNLNKEWVPAQTLGTGQREEGVLSDVSLLIRPRTKEGGDRTAIVVSASYTATAPAKGEEPATSRRAAVLFELNPELYADDLLGTDGLTPEVAAVLSDLEATAAATATAARVAQIFVDPVAPGAVVPFDHPAGSDALSWFSVDHRGGSFLCRPAVVSGTEGVRARLARNRDRLPEWSLVDAAVELPDGTRYFFDNTAHGFATAKPRGKPGEPVPTGSRWGRQPGALAEPGEVDAVLVRGDHTFVFSGERYLRFTGTPFGLVDAGYPRSIAENDEGFPAWTSVQAACTDQDGVEYFFSHARDEYVTSAALDEPHPTAHYWSSRGENLGKPDAFLVTEEFVFVIVGDRYTRHSIPAGRPRRGTGRTTRASRSRRPQAPPRPGPETVPWQDAGYPKPLAGNPDGLPDDFRIGAALLRQGTVYWFDNKNRTYVEVTDDRRRVRPTFPKQSAVAADGQVEAAWVAAGRLYLTRGAEYVRYTLNPDGSAPDLVDESYPKAMPRAVDAAFTRDDDVYLFGGDGYVRIDARQEPNVRVAPRPVAGVWGELPRDGSPPFDAALDSDSGLYLFVGDEYVVHSKTVPVRRPYERAGLPFELIRLTTGTASELNRKLLSGGVPALLDLATQETDELALSTDPEAVGAIRVRGSMVDAGRLPTGSHLDFQSANGLYYSEIFFHAPFLIAQALNGAQRFADARRWYEYVFDPTNPDSYWRFLPFLTADLRALAESVDGDLAELRALGLNAEPLAETLTPVLTALRTLAPMVEQNREPGTEQERAALLTVTSTATQDAIATALRTLPGAALTDAQQAVLASLRERAAVLSGLEKQFDVLGDREGLLKAYRDNPFDPHAIADLRPVAHRRAVVLGYIDNLLDWGDLLFRQYTPESVDEARMLYVLAYDLLGEPSVRLGTRLPAPARSFGELDEEPGTLDLIGYLTGGGALLEGTGAVHDSVASGYFHIPANTVFGEYRTRVEDRLRKIRDSLNILGVAQPLPLFDPPLDPMALVRSVATGAGPESVVAGAAVAPPPYRFAVVFRRAQELVDRLRQFGGELLAALDRRDTEELGMLRGRQEGAILELTRDIKEAQIRIATEQLAELASGQSAAQERAGHYQKLIDEGMSTLERAQLDLMSSAASAHFASSLLKVASGIAHAVPQVKVGPFIIGVEHGGRQLGDSIDKASEFTESVGEGLSVVGEILGMQAQHERSASDWDLQLRTAQSDLVQIGHQMTGATHQLAIARREAELLDREIAHGEAVDTFLRDRFGTAELHGWMAGQLGALYFQAYHLAHEVARSAERAYQFERGVPEGAASHIRSTYWESRRAGLLAGETLAIDLERLGKAYADTDSRGLEITKQVSLLALDPLALLRLRETGTCEFALTEAEFDQDFPGHYRRQLRTVTVSFVDADGQPSWVNAMLTQLSHKTVLEPDPKAVKHLLDPVGPAPATIRADWRPSQQIALSEVDGDNNGLFELRYDDDRYLPFERTGAVSTWRLERSGRMATPPYDVLLTVRYSAEQGGQVFANAVRGMLKPQTAARFFDLAREFPAEWAAFLEGDSEELRLPLTPEFFPEMGSRQIGAVHASYDVAGGGAFVLALAGQPNLELPPGRLLPTPGLTVGADPGAPLVFTARGDRQPVRNIGLVLTYQAQPGRGPGTTTAPIAGRPVPSGFHRTSDTDTLDGEKNHGSLEAGIATPDP